MKKKLGKQARINILRLFHGIYDETVFSLLVRELYSEDEDVSIEAIRSSANPGNETAINELKRFLEKGTARQKIEAVRSQSMIGAPSSFDFLLNVFYENTDEMLKSEILQALGRIRPHDKTVRMLSLDILKNDDVSGKLKEEAIMLLVQNGRFPDVIRNLTGLSVDLETRFFEYGLSAECRNSAEMAQYLILHQDWLSNSGRFKLALLYMLRPGGPKAAVLKRLLQEIDEEGVKGLCTGLLQLFPGKSSDPLLIFRVLAELQYYSQECEQLVGDVLALVIGHVRKVDILLYNDLCRSVLNILHSVLVKSLKNFLLSRDISNIDESPEFVLSDFLQKYANPAQMETLNKCFSLDGERKNGEDLIRKISASLVGDEKARIEKTFVLFEEGKPSDRLVMQKVLTGLDNLRPVFLRRLNRMVRLAGTAGVRQSVSQILSVLNFSRENRITYLTESSVVTLCQLHDRVTIEGAPFFLSNGLSPSPIVNGLLRGMRYLPASRFAGFLYSRILDPDTPVYSFAIAVESFFLMEGEGRSPLLGKLLSSFDASILDERDKSRISRYFGDTLDPSFLPTLIVKACGNEILFYFDIISRIAQKYNVHTNSELTRLCIRLLESGIEDVCFKAMRILLIMEDESGITALAENLRDSGKERTAKIFNSLQGVYTHQSVLIAARYLWDAGDERSDEFYAYLADCLHSPSGRILISRLCAMLELPDAGSKIIPEKSSVLENYSGYLLCICIDSFSRLLAVLPEEKIASVMDGLAALILENAPQGMQRLYRDSYGIIYLYFDSGLAATRMAHKMLKNYPKSNWAIENDCKLKFILDTGKIMVLSGQCAGPVVSRILSVVPLTGPDVFLMTEQAEAGMEGLINFSRYGQFLDSVTGRYTALHMFKDFYIKDELLDSALDLTAEDSEGGLLSFIRAIFSRELYVSDGVERTAIIRLWQKISMLLTQDGFFTGK